MPQEPLLPLSHEAVETLAGCIVSNEDWLVKQTIQYAKRHGYTQYTSTQLKDWQFSISGLSAALVSALETAKAYPEIEPDENILEDPFTIFGVTAARRHRSRGVTLGMFLGLMKYYRQSYVDLIESADLNPNQRAGFRYFIDRFFDRVELGVCTEWNAFSEDQKTKDLQENNRLLTLVEERSSELLKTNEKLRQEIIERKEAEKVQFELYQQLLHSQKMEAIGTLAGGIAHDFNNVLAAILGYTELVKEHIPNDPNITDYLAEVMTACHRAKQLVKQILTFSGKENGNQLPARVDAIVLETLQLLKATIPATIQIKQQVDSDCGSVMISPTHIHQILMNLCANAYHAMRETGGILSVSLCSLKAPSTEWERNLLVKPGPYIRLSVSDSGHGMDEDTRKRIFEPYFTTKKRGEGTGLGLSVIQGLVQNHGGYIMVFSELEKGTVFHVYLPETDTALAAEENDSLEEIPGGSEHILIVDDETALVVMWQQQLESLGYRVTACSDSEVALTLFRRNPDAFDLVLTDMNMPNLTGSRLSKVLMDIRPDIPIILSTGYDETMTVEKAEALGIKAFLLKPVMQMELAKTIRRVLGK